MSRQLPLRLLETFFRRWLLYLVPVAVFLALGVASVWSTEDEYVATGVVYVDDETLLATLTEVRAASGQWWKSAAELASEQMTSAFQTDGLVLAMAERAGMEQALADGTATIGDVRRSVSVAPNGSNLIQVRAARAVPEESSKLAAAAVDSFIDFVIESNLSESSSAETFLAGLVGKYEQDVAQARGALDTYLQLRPGPESGSRPALEQTEIDRLQSAIQTAEERYKNAIGKLEGAQLASAQTRADVSQRFRVVDEPQTPTAPVSSLRETAMTLAMFGLLGVALSATAVVAAALLDRSIRNVGDVTERLHSVVLAALPEASPAPPQAVQQKPMPLRPVPGA